MASATAERASRAHSPSRRTIRALPTPLPTVSPPLTRLLALAVSPRCSERAPSHYPRCWHRLTRWMLTRWMYPPPRKMMWWPSGSSPAEDHWAFIAMPSPWASSSVRTIPTQPRRLRRRRRRCLPIFRAPMLSSSSMAHAQSIITAAPSRQTSPTSIRPTTRARSRQVSYSFFPP